MVMIFVKGNLAIPKTHHQSDVTLCSKNLAMGLIDSRKEIHAAQSLASVIRKANDVIARGRVIINILDGRYGQEGLGPHFGDPIDPRFILFGSSAWAVDIVGSRLMGFDPSEIEHLRPMSNKRVRLTGDSIQVTPFKKSPLWEFTTDRSGTYTFLFWFGDNGIGYFRLYCLDQDQQRDILLKERRIHFSDPQITKEQADDLVFDGKMLVKLMVSQESDFNLSPE